MQVRLEFHIYTLHYTFHFIQVRLEFNTYNL